MTCMHPYLIWNIGPPSLMFHYHRVPCLLSKTFFVLSMYWPVHVLVIHSTVNATPILGCLRLLLVSSFIKLDNPPKCGVDWFIMNKLNQSFIFWILLRIVLSLIVRIVPTLIKRFSIVDLILDFQSIMNLPLVETSLFKYMLSSFFLEII